MDKKNMTNQELQNSSSLRMGKEKDSYINRIHSILIRCCFGSFWSLIIEILNHMQDQILSFLFFFTF